MKPLLKDNSKSVNWTVGSEGSGTRPKATEIPWQPLVHGSAVERTETNPVYGSGRWQQSYWAEFYILTRYRAALNRRAQWERDLRQIFKKVDFIALPTLQILPPRIPSIGRIALLEARVLVAQNTVAVNFAGNPALAIPIPVADKSIPVTSLQLIGPRLSEAALLNAGRLIEAEHSQIRRSCCEIPARTRWPCDQPIRFELPLPNGGAILSSAQSRFPAVDL